jgi:hypothetical protein
MTAKEMVQRAKEDRMFIFERSEFEDFCNRLCHEQREICTNIYTIKCDKNWSVIKGAISNAPMPEI